MVDQRPVLGWLQILKPTGRDASVKFIVSFIAPANMVSAMLNIPFSVEFKDLLLVMLSYDLTSGTQVLEAAGPQG